MIGLTKVTGGLGAVQVDDIWVSVARDHTGIVTAAVPPATSAAPNTQPAISITHASRGQTRLRILDLFNHDRRISTVGQVLDLSRAGAATALRTGGVGAVTPERTVAGEFAPGEAWSHAGSEGFAAPRVRYSEAAANRPSTELAVSSL